MINPNNKRGFTTWIPDVVCMPPSARSRRPNFQGGAADCENESTLVVMTTFNQRKARGFTLIELLVVIAIIGILSSVVLASLSAARAKSRDARRIADIDQLRTALEIYFDLNSTYPTTTNTGIPQVWDSAGTSVNGGTAPGVKLLATGTLPIIAKIPNPPSEGYYYYYCAVKSPTWVGVSSCNQTSANTATAYLLGADLERFDNSALKTDADVVLQTSTNFSGLDTTSCQPGYDQGYCYDISN